MLPLHDEIIYEVRNDKTQELIKILQTKMANCVNLRVNLPIRIKAGENWGEMIPYNFFSD